MISSYTMAMRVLLVEDEHKIASYVKRGLQESGYAVDAVFTGRDALDWVGAAPYDLIILDIMLPVIDGLAATRLIRKLPNLASTPIIAVSAHDTSDFQSEAIEAGCDTYVTKPIDFAELEELIAKLLQK